MPDEVDATSRLILLGARAMRGSLAMLLGNDAPAFDSKLEEMLELSDATTAADRITALVRKQESTRLWLRNFIDLQQRHGDTQQPNIDANTRQFDMLAGNANPQLLGIPLFYCPKCGFSWFQREVGQAAPAKCPCDATPLMPLSFSNGQ